MQFTDLKTQYAVLKTAIDARIQRVLAHGQYIMGPEVAEMEAALVAYTGAPHCVAVASGTEALLIALMAIGVEAAMYPGSWSAWASEPHRPVARGMKPG